MGCDETAKYRTPCIVSKITFPVLCIVVIHTFYFFCPVLLYTDLVLLFITCCGYFFLSFTCLLVLPVPPSFVCETSCLATCPFLCLSRFLLQPRKCDTWQVCLMFTFSAGTTLRSHISSATWMNNVDKKFHQLFVEEPNSNIWSKIPRLLLNTITFTKSVTVLDA
jgi:hypothetical protein